MSPVRIPSTTVVGCAGHTSDGSGLESADESGRPGDISTDQICGQLSAGPGSLCTAPRRNGKMREGLPLQIVSKQVDPLYPQLWSKLWRVVKPGTSWISCLCICGQGLWMSALTER